MDEDTLEQLDRLSSTTDRTRSRSALVRQAVREFAARQQRGETDARERAILRQNRVALRKEALALVRAQSEPE